MTALTENERAIVTKYDLFFEGRLSKVEADTKNLNEAIIEIKKDLRWIIGINLAGYGSLVALMGSMFILMAHGFKWF